MKFPIPEDELDRLSTLRSYNILDTPHEESFDRVTRLASRVFDVPVAMVSLSDEKRQWFKSCVGLDIPEAPRDVAFCAHAILQSKVYVVADALEHPTFKDNPLVTGEPGFRFYAGAPLTVDGHNLGTLCLLDYKARTFDERSRGMLHEFGQIICDQLETRKAARELEVAESEVERTSDRRLRFISAMAKELRTPMNMILASTQTLQKLESDLTTDEQKSQTRRILRGCAHAVDLIDDVLDAAENQAKRPRSITAIEPAPIVEACIARAREWAGNRGINIHWQGETASKMFCRGNERYLRRALLNVLSNVSQRGTSSSTIEITAAPASGPRVRIGVRDLRTGVRGPAKNEAEPDPIEIMLARIMMQRMGGDLEVEADAIALYVPADSDSTG